MPRGTRAPTLGCVWRAPWAARNAVTVIGVRALRQVEADSDEDR